MAWTVDQATIGTPATGAGDATTLTLTTNVAVAAGSWIFLSISNWHPFVELLSVADNGPGLTWTVVLRNNNGNTKTALAKAHAPSGMASGTVITATYGAAGTPTATGYRGIAGAAFAGGGAGSVTDGTHANNGSTAAHSVSPSAGAAGALIVQSAHLNGDSVSSTPDANTTELADWNLPAGPQTYLLQYRIAPSSGATTAGGTWAVALGWTAVGGAFSETGAPPTTITLTPATETDSARPLSLQNNKTLGVATETDAAVALSRQLPTSVTLTPGAEQDTAVPLSVQRRVTLGVAAETDAAQALAHFRARTLTPAVETDVAPSLPVVRNVTLGLTTETDAALALSYGAAATPTVYPPMVLVRGKPRISIGGGLYV